MLSERLAWGRAPPGWMPLLGVPSLWTAGGLHKFLTPWKVVFVGLTNFELSGSGLSEILGTQRTFAFKPPQNNGVLKAIFCTAARFPLDFFILCNPRCRLVSSEFVPEFIARRFFGWVTLQVVLLPKVSPGLQIITLLYIATLLLTIIKVTECCINNFLGGRLNWAHCLLHPCLWPSVGDNPSHFTLSLLPACSAPFPPRRESPVLFNCLFHRVGRRWLCNPKGFSVFIPLQPENILNFPLSQVASA